MAQAGAPVTILIVDDDVSVQKFAGRVLTTEGYRVLAASDVREALDLAETDPSISLAIIDVMLPAGNGIELATTLVAMRPEMRVLYTSGFAAESIQTVQHQGSPTAAFLPKPFSINDLVKLVHDAIPAKGDDGSELDAAQRSTPPATPHSEHSGAVPNSDAEYRLESPVRCSQCGETITTLKAVRLLRTHVNFTSTLPRRGRVLTCPCCSSVIPAELTNF